jgi:Uncharacterised MFS-type transporter YbfB
MRCANGSSPSGRHRPQSGRQPCPIRLPVKPTASAAEALAAKKFYSFQSCLASGTKYLPAPILDRAPGASRGPLSFARVAETLSLPADLAPLEEMAPGIVAIILSALLVGSMFTVITMAGFQEGREVGGARMIAAMASAFAVGQIVGPIAVSVAVRADGSFVEALLIACLLLVGSAWVISRTGHTGASAQ